MEEHVESLSTMLVQAEKQLTLTKSALEDSSTARNELKALVGELEDKNDLLERTVQAKEAEIKRLSSELEDASRTANVFEDELRDVATKLSDASGAKEGLAKRIDSYHTQEDNYRRYTNDLVNFSARAGAALATGVQDAISAVDLLNRVDHDITGTNSSSSSSDAASSSAASDADKRSSNAFSSAAAASSSGAGTGTNMPIGAALQARLSEVLTTGVGNGRGGTVRAPSDIWEVASFLEARVDLAVKVSALSSSCVTSVIILRSMYIRMTLNLLSRFVGTKFQTYHQKNNNKKGPCDAYDRRQGAGGEHGRHQADGGVEDAAAGAEPGGRAA